MSFLVGAREALRGSPGQGDRNHSMGAMLVTGSPNHHGVVPLDPVSVVPYPAGMVRIDIRYDGSLRCSAVHGPSSTQLWTDPPLDNHGRGESFSPSDLVATALGTCMLTIMGIVAERHGWKLEGATARVEKSMTNDPRRRIGELSVQIRVPGAFDGKAREALEKAALSCPVHASLHPAIATPVAFEWDPLPIGSQGRQG